jgi:hypothetical protein
MALLLWPVAINIENTGPDLSAFMSSEIQQFSSPSVAIQNQAVQVVGVQTNLQGPKLRLMFSGGPQFRDGGPQVSKLTTQSGGETTTDSC